MAKPKSQKQPNDSGHPPFNMSDWGGEHLRQDARFFSLSASNGQRPSPVWGEGGRRPDEVRRTKRSIAPGVRCRILFPPVNNTNYAWIQHFIHHLWPVGVAGFVMANGAMSTQTSNEGEIRKAIIEADLVDCMIALPGQLFSSTQIPASLGLLAKNENADAKRGFRCKSDATGEVRRKTEASPVSPKKSTRYINSSTARRHEKPLVQKSAISTIQHE